MAQSCLIDLFGVECFLMNGKSVLNGSMVPPPIANFTNLFSNYHHCHQALTIDILL